MRIAATQATEVWEWSPSGVLRTAEVATTAHYAEALGATISGQKPGARPLSLSHVPAHPLGTNFTCMLCFDVCLVFDGTGKGFVTGAALEG